MSSAISARPGRVWRALTDATECIAWDDYRLSALDSIEAYPKAGEMMRWRYQMGSIPIIMKEVPIEIVPGRKFQSKISIGTIRFEQTFTLALEQDPASPESGAKTLLGMKVVASNSAPVLGAVVDRFEVRRITIDRVDATLRAITKWCENST